MNENKMNKFAPFCVAATMAVIVLRDLFFTGLPFILFSALCLISALLLDRHGRFMYLLALLPFCRGLPYSEMVLIVLAVDVFFSLWQKQKIMFVGLVPILLLFIIEIIDLLHYATFANYIFYLVAYMLLVSYVVANKVFLGHEKQFILAYSFGTLVAVLSVIIREIRTFGLDKIFTYNMRFGSNIEGNASVTNFNTNEMGLYCALAVAMLLVLYTLKTELLSIFLATCITFAGLLSISRTYFILVVATWLCYLALSGIKIKSIVLTVLVLAIAVILILCCFPEISKWTLEYFQQRGKDAQTDGMGGRAQLMSVFFQLVFSNYWSLLFGFSMDYVKICSNGGAHNGLQEMLVCWGVFGFIVASVWILTVYRQVFKMPECKKNKRLLRLMPIGIFWVFIMSLQLFTMHNYLFVMLLSMLSLTVENSEPNSLNLKTA